MFSRLIQYTYYKLNYSDVLCVSIIAFEPFELYVHCYVDLVSHNESLYILFKNDVGRHQNRMSSYNKQTLISDFVSLVYACGVYSIICTAAVSVKLFYDNILYILLILMQEAIICPTNGSIALSSVNLAHRPWPVGGTKCYYLQQLHGCTRFHETG